MQCPLSTANSSPKNARGPFGAHLGSWDTHLLEVKGQTALERSMRLLTEITAWTPAPCRRGLDSTHSHQGLSEPTAPGLGALRMKSPQTPSILANRVSVTPGVMRLYPRPTGQLRAEAVQQLLEAACLPTSSPHLTHAHFSALPASKGGF